MSLHVSRWLRYLTLLVGLTGLLPGAGRATSTLDDTPRIAVLSAFQGELALLLSRVDAPQSYTVNGVSFTTGVLQGKPVVLFLSGVSMTNTAMTTQLVLDRFHVTHLVFSGIAGGVNPALNIGDVTVAQRWGQYLEVLMARETAPGKYSAPPWMDDVKLPNFGMLHPRPVTVRSDGHSEESKFWFEADAQLLALARSVQGTVLDACDTTKQCLTHSPKLVVGGNGVSGQAFVDNRAFREYVFNTFEANVLDMETAATAMVAYSNGVPFIAFRSLSDLAGGGGTENEMDTFLSIAANNSAKVLLAFLAAWK
ncbi:5'-methylthioadenosine/S-adenosylhomocysteine nucleosidase [Rhodoferax lithotrophicus]|uniref:5'-methylthioadenosine/S-adenosylhomocysteine nucleosidase n=1 Tax=Rhodoferax lithotrophicus TaxID=2798804 RepID=A0ABN6DFI8_9BURK|nr:5'-methylthioadenosine/S-adenosylhomocysteine nucleosidase [Rhodoferax sp. MIZ03]BCO29764.1 5'-methylthioadenosine/S-adenosylhomocysteine nucleosidase [Rhodoferax sp. MIZ03]